MRTLNLLECAEFLKIERVYAMKLAGEGKLPGAKIGKAWVFLEEDLVAYLRTKVREQTEARLITFADEQIGPIPAWPKTLGRPRKRHALPAIPTENDAPPN